MNPYKFYRPYKKYLQKSNVFLYPALGIKHDALVVPEQTFISFGDVIKPEDRKLLVLYRDLKFPFHTFERDVLRPHPMYASSFLMDGNEGVVYIFDFDTRKDDWDNFLRGRYSQLSPELKQSIRCYFQPFNGDYIHYIDSYLFPEKYFKQYAHILDVDIDVLKEAGELTNPYDQHKEDFLSCVSKCVT